MSSPFHVVSPKKKDIPTNFIFLSLKICSRYITACEIVFKVFGINRQRIKLMSTGSPVALQLRPPPPKVSARAPAHRSCHFRGVKLKSCIKKIHHNLYISKQANVRIKHADTEGASHKKFGTDARVQ